MYVNSVQLQQTTNREDLFMTVSIFDDDLNVPINLAGITGGGTFNNWTVTDGAIITPSTTQLTIPSYPIGNSLSPVTLTVGVGLAIAAGDSVVIADASGQNTMMGYVLSYVAATGALTCQIGWTMQFEIRRPIHGGSHHGNGFSSFGGSLGVYDDCVPEIIAALGSGVFIIDVGFIQIMIPEARMKTLRPGSRRASMTMTDSVNTRQLFLAQLPLVSGGVTN